MFPRIIEAFGPHDEFVINGTFHLVNFGIAKHEVNSGCIFHDIHAFEPSHDAVIF